MAKGTKKVNAMEVIKKSGYPAVGSFTDMKGLQKFYKQLDTPTLEAWATELKAEYKPCVDSEPIHRMRVCMGILYTHFPKQETAKKKSKYADYTTETLIQMAIDNDVPVEVCDDQRILRMRCIMMLRAHKVID